MGALRLLQKDASPERAALKREYDLDCPLTGPGGLRRKLGAIDMEFFGRAYFPHYFGVRTFSSFSTSSRMIRSGRQLRCFRPRIFLPLPMASILML